MTENNVPAAPTATREALLVEAWTLLVPLFAEVGLELPTDVRISVGFGKGKMCSPEIQGQAWKREATEDLRPAVFVSPQVPHIAEALAVLIHQGIHVALDNEGGHGPKFAEAATRLGLTGKMRATIAGFELALELMKIAGDIERRLGRYDHAPLLLPTPVAARTVAASSGGAVAVKLHSGESSERNRHLSFYCAVHPGPVRMSASKASRNALVCTELTDDGICMGQLTRDKP
jgi:hypothetical protein